MWNAWFQGGGSTPNLLGRHLCFPGEQVDLADCREAAVDGVEAETLLSA